MILWWNIRKHLFFSGSTCGETLLWQKLLIPTPFYLKSILFLLISATLLYLSTIPCCCWCKKLASQRRKLLLPMKNLLLLLTKSPNARKFSSSVCFLSFFCFFLFSVFGLLRPLPQIYRVWLTQTHQKVLKQVTLSNKHMNHLFRAQGNLVHYRINP